MKKIHLFLCLTSIILFPLVAVSDTADDFLKSYFLIQESDAHEKGGEIDKAVDKYTTALKLLRGVRKVDPEWNANIITYRLKYCTDRITKNGGTVPPEDQMILPTGNTATYLLDGGGAAGTGASPERLASREKELDKARSEASREDESSTAERRNLEKKLKTVEEELKTTASGNNERVQALLKENESLKSELARVQGEYQTLKKNYDDLSTSFESMKKDLEEARAQLRAARSGGTTDEIQTLQKENSLLRAIAERQYQEDARRISAGENVTRSIEDLKKYMEALQSPLTPLSEEEKQALKLHAAAPDDATKLNATIKAKGAGAAEEAPDDGLPASKFKGKILTANPKEKFVVIRFTGGEIPPAKTDLTVFNQGQEVGKVRITEPVKPPLAPADIVSGEVQRGDLIR